ncbi:PREDICTED: uncharacterized protein LOC109205162 [Nicotiana attenuata]|uniref:uncharacterized protein LOC109205162 n=1 Tax=Nicotiana attenuata TaxID=49451 RepID=UPI0009056282|nr:PREDICTED: uncharacterized protein LOC109205162 [Nicotiana attenuata]
MAMMVLVTNVEKSMRCTIHWNGDFGYEVKGATGIKHIVKLTEGACSCRAWQLKGIPCAHGVAAIHHKRLNPLGFISEWYKKETYLKAYSHFIQPVPCIEMWHESTNAKVEPPPLIGTVFIYAKGVAQSQKSTSKKRSKADSQASTSKRNAKAKGGKGRSNSNLVQKLQNSDNNLKF